MKSGSLNLLEPSGPHRASYGIPLPLPNSCMSRGFSVLAHSETEMSDTSFYMGEELSP